MPTLDITSATNQSASLDDVETIQKTLKLFEEDRKESFVEWQFTENDKCSISEMAKAGFTFSGDPSHDDDSATCFVCGKVLDGWERTDDPWIEHQKHAANCQFVQMRRCEDELTVEEFLKLFKHIAKQHLNNKFRKQEAKLVKKIDTMREMIKNQQI